MTRRKLPKVRPYESNELIFRVRIPNHVQPGDEFCVVAGNHGIIRVKCPLDCLPGDSLQITVPNRDFLVEHQHPPILSSDNTSETRSSQRLFEASVPNNVKPGESFALLVEGVRILVTCPPNASPGSSIRFKVPLTIMQQEITNEVAQIKLKYSKEGWQRTLRMSDMKFQWVRVDDNGDVETNLKFDIVKSAYVRRLDCTKGQTSTLTLVPASNAAMGTNVRLTNGKDEITCSDIANAQTRSFDEKCQFFQEACNKLCIPWEIGHVRINVRRKFLVSDSVDAVLSLSRSDLRKCWRFEFIGEDGMDVGGLTREWFQLVTEEIFDPDRGLWQSSHTNQMLMEINPASEFCCEDHLKYFRFLGRLMGRSLFDQQLVPCHMVQCLYKHILGWPVTFEDLKHLDEDIYRNLKAIETMAKNEEPIDEILCVNFTTAREILGEKEEVELVQGGANIEVTNENYSDYLEASLKYLLLDRVKPQLNELLLGFFDVIPEPLLAIFDFQELELLMCGLPHIDMEDWKMNTEYSGECEDIGSEHEVCQWFWGIVSDFDQEMKARLLQFVTGTSGVPPGGFSVLQSNDGNIRKFTIHGVVPSVCFYPRSQ